MDLNNKIDSFIIKLIKKGISPKRYHYEELYIKSYIKIEFTFDDYKKRLTNIKIWIKQLNILNTIPIIVQCTKEWYEARKGLLTASDTHNAILKNKSLIKNKSLNIMNFIKGDALTWGKQFESIANNIYSIENDNIKINDFGLIRAIDLDPNTDIPFYGASPDGITSTGIMLEIKCPYSRKIKENYIKPDYMSQVQGQMAVCKLKECDFAEFEFQKITKEEFLNIDSKYYGCFIINPSIPDKPEYYTDLCNNPIDCYLNILLLNSNNLKKIIYWKLNKFNIQRINFDENKWNDYYKPKIKEFWECVKSYEYDNKLEFRSDSE
jgi:putative phage-type endonuclease